MNAAAQAPFPPRVAVIGGGWAGLSAAVELSRSGCPVVIFESARQLGGRARRLDINGRWLDNGQHIMIGAYRETLRLLRLLGVIPERYLLRLPLRFFSPSHDSFDLSLPRLPAPLHLLFGLFGARGLSLPEKTAVTRFMLWMRAWNYRLPHDCSVAALLHRHGQSEKVIRALWKPLCLSALNTPLAEASAQVFLNVLRDVIGGTRADSDLLLPRTDLGSLFAEPAAAFVRACGGTIHLSARVDPEMLQRIDRPEQGWRIGTEYFDHVILAIAPQHLASFLIERPGYEELLGAIAGYAYEPIATVWFGYPPQVRLPVPMLAFPGGAGSHGQWVFDRGAIADNGSPGLLGCVLSTRGPWQELDNDTLAVELHLELLSLLTPLLGASIGPFPPPLWHRVIREQRATFACTPGLKRPGYLLPEPGLWLAGDYTYADFPATLEGAVRSGIRAARGILEGAQTPNGQGFGDNIRLKQSITQRY
ncbi:MAG: hydroxysqualene dehydroxylase HpnE [Betaproteobacteria bacterium]|nr:hydroxysqualene dehydroxylase HpnE [Betaproteobacteria bacterium]